MLGGPPPEYKLAIWHGFNLPLAMSVIALIGGLAYYHLRWAVYGLSDRYALTAGQPGCLRAQLQHCRSAAAGG